MTDWPQNEPGKSPLNIGSSIPLEAPLWRVWLRVPMQQVLLFSGGTKGRPESGWSSLVTKSAVHGPSLEASPESSLKMLTCSPTPKLLNQHLASTRPSDGPYALWNLRGTALGPSSLNQNVPGFPQRESPTRNQPMPTLVIALFFS